jgi:hypothetical protein
MLSSAWLRSALTGLPFSKKKKRLRPSGQLMSLAILPFTRTWPWALESAVMPRPHLAENSGTAALAVPATSIAAMAITNRFTVVS